MTSDPLFFKTMAKNLSKAFNKEKVLMAAIDSQNGQEIAIALIKEGIDNLEYSDEKGRTLLHNSIKNNHIEIARLLLEKGANIEARDEYGKTPIMFVKSVGMVQLLLNPIYDVNIFALDELGQDIFFYILDKNIQKCILFEQNKRKAEMIANPKPEQYKIDPKKITFIKNVRERLNNKRRCKETLDFLS